MRYHVIALAPHDFWIENENKSPYPASFLSREAAETAAIAINYYNAKQEEENKEPVHITLNTVPPLKPGMVKTTGSKKQRAHITLDGYAKPKDKTLTVTAKDEATEPQVDNINLVL